MRKRRGSRRRSYHRIIWIAGIIVFGFLAGFGAWKFFQNTDAEWIPSVAQTESANPPADAPVKAGKEKTVKKADAGDGIKKEKGTAAKKLAPKDISVRVLNESGITGAAAESAEVLKEKGFVISEVGNGETTSRQKTVFSVPKSAVDLFYGMPFACVITANDESARAVLRIGRDYR